MTYLNKPVADNIYYVGVNDRQKHLFENYLPLPNGVSYNSYLIVDEKVALVDTVDVAFADLFFRQIDEVLKGRAIDYLIVDHMVSDIWGYVGRHSEAGGFIDVAVKNKSGFSLHLRDIALLLCVNSAVPFKPEITLNRTRN